MATIKDVAKLAAVSPATVSRILNNTKRVSDGVRARVMQAIEEVGYKPNSIARSLILKRSMMIGVIISDISNRYYGQLVRGIENAAHDNGYSILLCDSNYDEDTELKYLNLLYEKRVDGIILSIKSVNEDLYRFFQTKKVPAVFINRQEQEFSSIRVDNFKEAYKAVSYLISQGHTKIGCIYAPFYDRISGQERLEGYKKALADNNIDYNEAYVAKGSFSVKSGYEAMQVLLNRSLDITALFCTNDEMAFGAMNCIHDCEFKVPDDISVIGFDDIDYAQHFRPKLTTMHQPIYETGAKSVDLLIKSLNLKEKFETIDIKLDAELIIRDTVKNILKK